MSLRTTVHPLYTILTKRIATSICGTTMRPNSTSLPTAHAAGSLRYFSLEQFRPSANGSKPFSKLHGTALNPPAPRARGCGASSGAASPPRPATASAAPAAPRTPGSASTCTPAGWRSARQGQTPRCAPSRGRSRLRGGHNVNFLTPLSFIVLWSVPKVWSIPKVPKMTVWPPRTPAAVRCGPWPPRAIAWPPRAWIPSCCRWVPPSHGR